MERYAIVTGSSSGFGLLTTIELAKQGFNVIATMRNLEKSKVFNGSEYKKEILDNIYPFHLDVTDSKSIEVFSEKVNSMDRVDVLVNNAGFAMGGFAEEVEVEGYRRQFETNVFGVMGVTQAVLPKMREQGFGKIINVSSISGRVGFPGLSPYVSSKFALEGYSESLRLELAPFGIQVALVEPGSFKTNIWSSGMEVTEQSFSNQSPYYDYMKKITSQLDKSKKNHGDPLDVARLIAFLSTKKKWKKLRYPIGSGISAMLFLRQSISWKRWERLVLKQLKIK